MVPMHTVFRKKDMHLCSLAVSTTVSESKKSEVKTGGLRIKNKASRADVQPSREQSIFVCKEHKFTKR